MPAPSTGADCDLILLSVLLLWNESSLGPSLWTKWNSLLFLMNGILNLTLFTLLPSDWLNQRCRRQWRENTALVPNSHVLNFMITGTTVFYRVLFCGFNRQICKKGIEFRDSSVFETSFYFSKSLNSLKFQDKGLVIISTPYMKSLQILIFSRQKVQNETF